MKRTVVQNSAFKQGRQQHMKMESFESSSDNGQRIEQKNVKCTPLYNLPRMRNGLRQVSRR